MRRILLIILLLCFPLIVLAGQGMGPGPGVKSYAVSNATDFESGMDGWSYSYVAGGDSGVNSSTTATISTVQSHSSTHSFLLSAHASYDSGADDYFPDGYKVYKSMTVIAGAVSFWVYTEALSTQVTIFNHYGNVGGTELAVDGATWSTSGWHQISYASSTNVGGHDITGSTAIGIEMYYPNPVVSTSTHTISIDDISIPH
jgi:hypothetical protein